MRAICCVAAASVLIGGFARPTSVSSPGRASSPAAIRYPLDAPTGAAPAGSQEWQWAASRADQVPDWVHEAAASITIAVIDTGADVEVPVLAAKGVDAYSVISHSSNVEDQVGHGTFVASLAAGAASDPLGMRGFGGLAKLMVVKATRDGGSFTDADEAAAITWAVDHGARIINLSFGGTQTSPTESDAIRYAESRGVLLVAAAGNLAQSGNPPVYPAALISRAGLVVGASDATGARAPFSTTGRYVDVLAPGVGVLGALASRSRPAAFSPVATPSAVGTYGSASGTSFAAPEVAGAAALVWAANPRLDAAGVAATIEATSSGHGTWSTDRAFGTIDVGAAVAQALTGMVPSLALPGVSTPTVLGPRKPKAKLRKAKPLGP